MIEPKFINRFSIFIILLGLTFGFLSYFHIKYQIYLWEFFIDGKIVAAAGIILYFYKRKAVIFSSDQLSLLKFEWQNNVLLFFVPSVIYSASILLGLIFKQTSFNRLDNAATLVLATFFDIPAVFVFSATTILIEEVIFRGILQSSLRQTHTMVLSTIICSLLWTVYALSEIFGIEEIDIWTIPVLVLFFASLGLFLTMLVKKYGSLWPGYSFRIGILTLTPIILTSRIVESDPFFGTSSSVFFTEGIIVSLLLIGITITLSRKEISVPETVQE